MDESWAGHIWNTEWFCVCLRWGYSYEAVKVKWKEFLNICGDFCPGLDRHKEWFGIPLCHMILSNSQVKKTVRVIWSWMALLRMTLEKILFYLDLRTVFQLYRIKSQNTWFLLQLLLWRSFLYYWILNRKKKIVVMNVKMLRSWFNTTECAIFDIKGLK